MDNLEKYLEEWTLTLRIPNDYNQGPRCPYAKSAKSKIVKCPNYNIFQFWAAVSEECEQFDTTDDITIIASNTIYKVHEIDSVVDALNIYLNVQNKNLWILQSCNEHYSMVFIQQITAIDDASKVLEKTSYYNKMHPASFSKFITYRRTLRNNLQRKL
mgnify:FL=1